MPSKNGRWSGQEKMFVKRYVETNDATYAAEKADYKFPTQSAHQMMKKPSILAEIVKQQTQRLFEEVLPLAVGEHIRVLSDAKTPAGAKVQAIKLAYDRALGPVDGKGSEHKDPSDMTPEELERARGQLLAELAARATPVTIEGKAEQIEQAPGEGAEHDLFG